MKRKEIEQHAKEMLEKHGLFSIPVNPVLLANKEGIKVHNANFSDDSISGIVARRGQFTTLLVNQSDHPFRKRFSIAHELGHHFLHLSKEGEIVTKKIDLFREYWDNTKELSAHEKNEIEANQFAAALLMPEQLVREYYIKTSSLVKTAKIFNVSEEAMGIRLRVLRLM